MSIKISDLNPRMQALVAGQLYPSPRKAPQHITIAPKTDSEPKEGYGTGGQPNRALKAIFQASGLPVPLTEYRFHPTRLWRFDYAWVKQKVALEVDGGVWSGGRHVRGSGFIGDMAKLNEAASLGWRVLRVIPQNLTTRDTLDLIQRTLAARQDSGGK